MWRNLNSIIVKGKKTQFICLSMRGDTRETDSIPGSGRSPGGGNGNTLQYSRLENPYGQRSLAGYSPWSRKELDATEQTYTHTHIYTHTYIYTYIYTHIYTYTHTHIYTYIHTHTYTHIYTYTNI